MTKRLTMAITGCSIVTDLIWGVAAAQPAKPKLYNTTKQKLLDGKKVFSFTQSKFDPAGYCEAAKHYDYTWFEMQHTTLEFKDIEPMFPACPPPAPRPSTPLPAPPHTHIHPPPPIA